MVFPIDEPACAFAMRFSRSHASTVICLEADGVQYTLAPGVLVSEVPQVQVGGVVQPLSKIVQEQSRGTWFRVARRCDVVAGKLKLSQQLVPQVGCKISAEIGLGAL